MLLITTHFLVLAAVLTHNVSHTCAEGRGGSFLTLATLANCGKDSRTDEARPQTADDCISAGYFSVC